MFHRVKVSLFLLVLSCLEPGMAQATSEYPVMTFAVMSDIHIYDNNANAHNRLIRALNDYAMINPELDLLVINGDLTNGFPSHYERLRQILNTTPHPPIHFTMGNHEFFRMLYNERGEKAIHHFPNDWSNERAIELFLQFTGYDEPYHDLQLYGYRFLFLSNEWHTRSNGKDGNLSEEQLQWLEQALSDHRDRRAQQHKPVFVFFHQPLPHTVPGSQYDRNVVQHERLRRILNRYPEVIYFSGHTHYNLRETKQRYYNRFLMVGSSSVMRNEESIYVEVYDDHLRVYGRDHRRRVWIPEASFQYRFNVDF